MTNANKKVITDAIDSIGYGWTVQENLMAGGNPMVSVANGIVTTIETVTFTATKKTDTPISTT